MEVSKHFLVQQKNLLYNVHSSAMMMKLLNSAMLNSTLIKLGKYQPNFEIVTSPFKIIKNFVKLFDKQIKALDLEFILDENVYGNKEEVERFKCRGAKVDIQLYKQIMCNIFQNACKFNKTKGLIKMTF